MSTLKGMKASTDYAEHVNSWIFYLNERKNKEMK